MAYLMDNKSCLGKAGVYFSCSFIEIDAHLQLSRSNALYSYPWSNTNKKQNKT